MYFELFETALTICDRFKLSPFDVMKQDAEDVIAILNHFMEKAEEENEQTTTRINTKQENEAPMKRRYDGFWDF